MSAAYEMSGSISPLSPVYRRCLTVLLVVGVISLVTSGLLFLHITYKLVLWKVRDYQLQRSQHGQAANTTTLETIDLSLGLSESQYYQTRQKAGGGASTSTTPAPLPPKGPLVRADTFQTTSLHRQKPPNPLLLLIYNLLLSDIWLATAYVNNAVWLSRDGIEVPSSTCHKQGWNVSFGSLVTSGFLFAISLFSYGGIIRGYKPSTRVVLMACAFVWIFSVILSSVPLLFVRADEYFRRETLWCWISEPHKIWRVTVYFWGFTTISGTFFIYTIIFYRLWREGRSSRFMPDRQASIDSSSRAVDVESTPLRPSGHHPAFLVYPCIYMITGTPVLIGTLVPALERTPVFMGVAGALLAATGLLDSALWSSIILFSNKEDIHNAGLDHFSFLRTPEGRTLGNIVLVQGGNENWKRASWHSKKKKDQGWWRLGENRNSSRASIPQQLLDHGQGIQLDLVTTVVVEGEGESSSSRHSRDQSRDGGYRRERSMESPV